MVLALKPYKALKSPGLCSSMRCRLNEYVCGGNTQDEQCRTPVPAKKPESFLNSSYGCKGGFYSATGLHCQHSADMWGFIAKEEGGGSVGRK